MWAYMVALAYMVCLYMDVFYPLVEMLFSYIKPLFHCTDVTHNASLPSVIISFLYFLVKCSYTYFVFYPRMERILRRSRTWTC